MATELENLKTQVDKQDQLIATLKKAVRTLEKQLNQAAREAQRAKSMAYRNQNSIEVIKHKLGK